MVNIFRPSTWLPARRQGDSRENEQTEASETGNVLEMPTVTHAPPAKIQRPLHDRIEELAYHKWCAAGCPPGQDMQFWLEAERELLEESHQNRNPRL